MSFRIEQIYPKSERLFVQVISATFLKKTFAYSDFIARSLTRNPELLQDLFESGDFIRVYAGGEYIRKVKSALIDPSPPGNEEKLSKALRDLRLREMIWIAWRDLASLADLDETMTDLSALADACIDQSLSLLYDWECKRSGIPYGTDNSRQYLVVFGNAPDPQGGLLEL